MKKDLCIQYHLNSKTSMGLMHQKLKTILFVNSTLHEYSNVERNIGVLLQFIHLLYTIYALHFERNFNNSSLSGDQLLANIERPACSNVTLHLSSICLYLQENAKNSHE